jgi:hypothetical protein
MKDHAAALRAWLAPFLDALCLASDSGALRATLDAAQLGAVVRIRPWKDGGVGLLELSLPAGLAATFEDLKGAVGPFAPLPQLDQAPRNWQAEWWHEGLPVAATVLVSEGEAGVVERVTVRRGRFRRG